MNFLTADVVIKADDSQLPAQLARAKTAVTRTVSAIKATYSKMAASFKAAFDKMVKYAKWAGLAIAGALTLATRAAMKQEDAQFLLAAALKISGEWTLKLQHRFNAFAASVQQATVYGDEEVLALMQLQKSLGVTSDKLEEAAKMSIGLATATGRDVQSMAMYVALAQQGEFTMLRRYIPALRSTTDATEQLKIVTEFAAAGFKLAEERAKTSSGALRQMRNALGDVAEVIGKAILPGLKDTAIAIKEWAERNQERIGRWAEIVVEKIKIVKDSLWALIKFMGTDWKKGIEYGLNVSKELFIGFGNSIYAILKHTFFRLANDVGGWTSQILEEMMVHSRAYGEKFRELVPWYSLGDRTKAKIEAEAYAEAQVQFYRKVKDQQRALELKDEKSLADELVKLAKETTNRIANIPKPKGYLEPPKPSPEISKGLGITALPFGG